ncbi:class F sortase [Candidatus Pacebacteria bacterium]|nr:class F sortase [Candidatus Paceibacterota bacterium]
MLAKLLTKVGQLRTLHRYLPVAVFGLLGVVIGAGIMLASVEYQWQSVPVTVVSDRATSTVLSAAEPAALRIPEIDLYTDFEGPLGLQADQTIEVPDSFTAVGWYRFAPTPGELGPAVVLGHVDSYEGPAVFWSLKDLEPGDSIFVDRVDGTTATFTVTSLEEHHQSGFPTEKVYGDLDHAGLRLITCSGTYDHSDLRYSHNLIVFAELTPDI